MKTSIETIDGKFVVTIGETRFTLTETTVDVQSHQAVSVRVSEPEQHPVTKRADTPRKSAYDLSDPNHPLRNPFLRRKLLS